MDEDKNIVDSFANVLKNRQCHKEQYISLYNESKTQNVSGIEEFAINDVISGVAKQLRAIQNADNAKKCSKREYISRSFQKSQFQPVHMLPFNQEPKQMHSNKFDTQCVSDTQLINMIDDAEAIIIEDKGLTQEFDTTFFQKNLNNVGKNQVNECLIKTDSCDAIEVESPKTNNTQDQNTDNILSSINKQDIDNNFSNETASNLGNDINNISVDICESLDDCFIEIHGDNKNINNPSNETNHTKDKETSSLMSETQLEVKPCTSSPLVFKLESFEKFETFALPIIKENHDDFETAKKVINSQIMNRELFIHSHAEPVLSDRDKDVFPVIENTTKFNSDLLQAKYENSDTKLRSINEDSMLFSSDEESDAENSPDQMCGLELPLTCALKGSSHNESGILDKTMYVGFQTASNKSIQICTDSFSKAKSLLDRVNAINVEELESGMLQIGNVDMDTTLKNNDDVVEDHLVNSIDSIPTIISCETSKNPNNMHENNDIMFNNVKSKNLKQYLHHEQPNFALNDCFISNSKEIKEREELVNRSKKENNTNNQKDLWLNTMPKEIQLKNDAVDSLISHDFGYLMSDNKKQKFCDNSKVNKNYMLDFEGSEISINSDSQNQGTRLETSILSNAAIKTALNDRNKILEQSFDVKKENLVSENAKNKLLDMGKTMCTNFVGFRTANNIQIKISTEAFMKTKNIFDNIDSDKSFPQKTEKDNFENLSSLKAVNNNNMSCFKAKPNKSFVNPVIPKNLDSASHITNSIKPNSKFISIGHNNDLSNTDIPIKTSLTNALSTKTSSAPIKITSDKLICDRKSEKHHNNIISNPLGKTELDTDSSHAACDSDANYILDDFKTANDKAMNKSKQVLPKTNDMFNNFDIDNITTNKNFDTHERKVSKQEHHTELFQGFKTASNKPVQISERALAVTKNIFNDIPLDENTTVNEDICSFKIPLINNRVTRAVGESRQISGSPLPKVKDVNKDISNVDTELKHADLEIFTKPLCSIDNMIPKSTLHGFKTASNKSVKISEKALSATKIIFKDISLEHENEMKTNDDGNNFLKENENLLETCKTSNPIFHGFKTASSKPVMISTEALAKSKKLFQDMDIDCDEDITKKQVENRLRNCDVFKELKPAIKKEIKLSENIKFNVPNKIHSKNLLPIAPPIRNNHCELKNANHIQISEETQKMIQKTFSDTKLNCEVDIPEDNILGESFFNTEVIKDFELTVCTENFMNNDTSNGKRSSSPILSCPRAKKRKKFETPIAIKKHVTPEITECNTIVCEKVYTFNQNYKKNKILTLKDLELRSIKNLGNDKTKDTVKLYLQFENLLDFEFVGDRNDIDNNKWKTGDIKRWFTESVNRKIIPDGWIENHLKLIIWKLLSYEIRFQCMQNICTVTNVLNQLKYRYDRELYNVERPALRKILEKDEVSTRRMILCVASVYMDGISVSSIKNDAQNIELLLTDGWYTIKAVTDRMIDRLVCDGKIIVGSKLVIYGAELLNCEEGISPWEDTSSVRLKISGNSTRRAKWDARLGFHSNAPILTNLSAVKPEGGKISHLRVHVTRVYPALYVEKFPDGSTLTRSERLENVHQTKYETDRQLQIEKLYDEMEKLSDQESQDSEGMDDGTMDTGSQISRLMKRCRDREGFREKLTSTQNHLLHQHTMKRREKFLQDFRTKFQDLVKQRGLDVPRNVVPLMKIRVADVEKEKISKAMITIWKPNESLQELIREGTWLDIYNVVPTSVRYSEIQISAGRQSIFRTSKFKEIDKLKTYIQTLKRQCYSIKNLQNPAMATNYNEIDTFGIVFLIEPSTKEFELKNQPFQNVYLSDADKNMICVNFWGGIKKFGFEMILDIGEIVTCVNLQKRAGNTRKNIPQFRATELSYFTKTPRTDTIKRKVDDFVEKFFTLDKRKFIDDCVALKNNFHIIKCGNIENISPYRLNASDYNVHKNKMFIDSPLVKCTDVNYNLTGLDFESTFKQTITQELSPQMLARKRKVDEKIARLKMYGEPPPLSPIHILNKSNNAANQFKSPLRILDISSSDTNANILPHNNGEYKMESNSTSPILNLNRTYVKRPSINPVKLNFSSDIESECKNNIVDPFAEEFDCSPPLSLD